MAITKEGEIKKQIKKVLDDEGVYYFMPSGNGYGRSGIPDFVGIIKGRFIGIEAKADNLMPTAIQTRELSRIQSAGGTGVYVNADNIAQLVNLIQAIKNDTIT